MQLALLVQKYLLHKCKSTNTERCYIPAANTLEVRGEEEVASLSRASLDEEQTRNQDAKYKIIGITLETRPDFITRAEVRRLRRYGCTRVQIGLQHTNDTILELINRQCTNEQARSSSGVSICTFVLVKQVN